MQEKHQSRQIIKKRRRIFAKFITKSENKTPENTKTNKIKK